MAHRGRRVLVAAAIAFVVAKALAPNDRAALRTSPPPGPPACVPRPAFALHDEKGTPLTLASLHGRPAIVTFIDPLCRDFCPREASVLSEAAATLGNEAPAVVSVSVNPWADSPRNLREDALHWKLAPGWRWGLGSRAELARVWRDYGVAWQATTQKIAGVTIRKITHTGAAYLIDANGDERALFLYPFTTGQVVDATRKMLSADR